MSPTIALKCRLARGGPFLNRTDGRMGMGQPPVLPSVIVSNKNNSSSSFRSVSLGSEREVSPLLLPPPPPPPPPNNATPSYQGKTDEDEGVQLLLGIANIVSKEVANSGSKDFFAENDDIDKVKNDQEGQEGQDSHVHIMPSSPTRRGLLESPSDDMFAWSRARSVSIESPNSAGAVTTSAGPMREHQSATGRFIPRPLPAIITPVDRSSGGTRSRFSRKASLKFALHKAKREQIKFPKLPQLLPISTVQEYTKKAFDISAAKGSSITTIGRKKFSWKNYPELEAFLIANREEYLRHSALNYTVQQKHYNNRLTERLLELASQHGYVFDEAEFNFVTVRDRIRCYYKSFVQSSKKRGVVLGYAARKAGILTTADLQKSARQEGTIYTPQEL